MNIINTIKKLNNYTWLNIFTTVLFFIVVQTLFFQYIASKQYDNILLYKSSFISQLGNYNSSIKELINVLKTNAKENLKENAEKSKNKRDILNYKLLVKYCLFPIIIVSFILLIILIYTFTQKTKKWSYIESISLLLILGSYLTELYFFFFIIRNYEIIGDHEIFYKSLNSFSNNLELKLNTTTTTQKKNGWE
jgi:hypothetical protein